MVPRTEWIRRFLDGELDGAEREALAKSRAADPELDREVTTLTGIRDALAGSSEGLEPRPDLADRVMAAVATAPLRRRGRPWLRASRSLIPAMAVAGLALVLAAQPFARRPGLTAAAPPATGAKDEAPTAAHVAHFRLVAPSAHTVELAGEWSGWTPVLLSRDASGAWTTSVELPAGEWRYQFIVDGAWVDDPLAEGYRPDGYGGRNAVITL
jgi:anti-sigma factor RsiW